MKNLYVSLVLHHCEFRQHLTASGHLLVGVDTHVKTSLAVDEADDP
jgi:hypothetical protein